MRREKLAGLEVIFAGGDDGNGRGDGPLVVLLHGFGAPGEDLVPLEHVLNVHAGTRFAFPAAPIEVEPGFGGRAWWMIDVMALQMAMAQGRTRDLAAEVPPGLPEARAQILALVDELDAPRLVLGGFSQGAMLSLDVALHAKKPITGVVMMSGTLLAEREWLPLMAEKKTLPVFQSHGMQDPLLPFAVAERLRDHLITAGLSVEWVPFRGGHDIPQGVLHRLSNFLTRVLS